jgi:hypothetical protein
MTNTGPYQLHQGAAMLIRFQMLSKQKKLANLLERKRLSEIKRNVTTQRLFIVIKVIISVIKSYFFIQNDIFLFTVEVTNLSLYKH